MSPELKDLVDSYSDTLIKVLGIPNVPDTLLADVLLSIDETHTFIDKGLIR